MTDTAAPPARADVADAPAYQWYAAGQWRDAPGSRRFDDFEPYTGDLFARVPNCGAEEAKIAVAAANDAFPGWAGTPPAEKARLFVKAAEIVRCRRGEIAGILARETGSTIPFSAFQQDLVITALEQAANWVYLPKGEVLQSNLPDTHSIGVRRPLGVVASFTPWNGANILAWRAVLNPLAAGCTAVVKPSEFAPISVTQAAVDLMDERIKEAVSLGATLHTGGTHEGLVYHPTVLTDVPYEATVSNEETFGPLVIVEPVDTPEEAVTVANRVHYGLTSSILAADTYKAFELAPKLLHGIINVNSPTVNDEIHAPMGGVRDSGWGRTGPDSLADFTDVIWINATSSERQFPF
jgi:acyl-CoA reductase-like NAD-dependent aldehyde dehydrogenase